MSKQNKNYDDIDEIIKMAFEAEKADTIPVLTAEDLEKEGIPLPPADMLDKIKAEYAPKPNRTKLRIILVAAAIIILIAGAMSIQGIKGNLFNFTSNITGNAIEFLGGNVGSYTATTEEMNTYTYAEDFLNTTILKPTYLPDGYSFDSMNRYNDNRIMLVYKNGDTIIKFTQKSAKLKSNNGENLDANSGNTYTISTQNTTVMIGNHKHSETGVIWFSAVWSDDNLSYKVDANCTKEELEKFILGLE